ncbi:hypothetical protein [Thalassotalea maritima]|uniref:hypothetical protein n=1 Tax=Thalassotalea maritima TaxID=3242416 RepID=UPI003528CA46
MDIDKIRIGMLCSSEKGSGRVTWIDGTTRTVYIEDMVGNNAVQVGIDELIDDPQVHNHEDHYY